MKLGTSGRRRRRAELIVVSTLVTCALTGCFNPFRPEVTPVRNPTTTSSALAPRPTSPRNVMRLFKWCWDQRNATLLREVFTDDFRFAFAEADSQGNRFPGRVLTREDELETAKHLFIGGNAAEPPANSVSLEYNSPLIPSADTRAGKNATWHREFRIDVDITIRTDELVYRIVSKAVFFVVRGDSATIPRELRDRGFLPDRRRWYIERYEEIGPASVVAIDPSRHSSAGRIEASLDPTLARPRFAALGHDASRAGAASRRDDPYPVSWGWIKSLYRN